MIFLLCDFSLYFKQKAFSVFDSTFEFFSDFGNSLSNSTFFKAKIFGYVFEKILNYYY